MHRKHTPINIQISQAATPSPQLRDGHELHEIILKKRCQISLGNSCNQWSLYYVVHVQHKSMK